MAPKKRLHLVSNAHLDPVWLWEWEEGAAEAISTFRSAADLCEEFDDFVFNHNEVVLYQWVEEYEPALFKRIQRLVKRGKWHIMGGWHLQPDCNMPCGESFVRQILLGKAYFKEKFGVEPSTAINFDPFGHTRGLVQILAKSGYDSYIFCRPTPDDCPLPAEEFTWVGYDGSEVIGNRVRSFYISGLGGARHKVEKWMRDNPDHECGLELWGVGNHGGGPSRTDLHNLAQLMKETMETEIVHSMPEDYFRDLQRRGTSLPRHEKDLNPWGVGCYTSMIRLKQKQRRLENELYMAEKMVSAAFFEGLMKYPQEELREATRDLMTGQFHDILPGSSIPAVEDTSLRLFDHGLEMVSRVKARSFFALAQGQPKTKPAEIPIMVYNPHPYRVKTLVECEFQLTGECRRGAFNLPIAYSEGRPLPSQAEQEASNLAADWRKKIVFAAELAPSTMNRFDCRMEGLPAPPKHELKERNGRIRFKTKDLEFVVNARTGLVDRYRIGGVDYVGASAFQPIVMHDDSDSWGSEARRFSKVKGRFRLMSRRDGNHFSGLAGGKLPSVRVIEDGPVRSVVETLFAYGRSAICQRYLLPKAGSEIEVETRVYWNEKDRMLKLAVPLAFEATRYVGQVAYGVGDLPDNGDEAVAQKWVGVVSKKANRLLTCINDGIYGSSLAGNELRLSLLRSPCFSGLPTGDKTGDIVQADRFTPRMDQGERLYRFWVNGGSVRGRLEKIDREALVKNEKPFALSFCPQGGGRKPKPLAVLSDSVVQIVALKKAEGNNDLIVRLFEPTGRKRSTTLSLPLVPMRKKVEMSPFEIKTLRINPKTRQCREVDLLERPPRR